MGEPPLALGLHPGFVPLGVGDLKQHAVRASATLPRRHRGIGDVLRFGKRARALVRPAQHFRNVTRLRIQAPRLAPGFDGLRVLAKLGV